MANIKISALPVFTDADGLDKIPVVDVSAGDTKAYTINQLLSGDYTIAGDKTYTGSAIWTNTDGITVPVGSTAERPSNPNYGMFRYNTDVGLFEGFTGTWGSVGGGQMYGTVTNKVVAYNSNTLTEAITVLSGSNASAVGPITVSDTGSITIEDGARLVIL